MWITRRIEFSASHSCLLPNLTESENRLIYGDDANPHGHGHNYVLEVTIEGEPDSVTGMVIDLKVVKDILTREIVDSMDHRHLNHEVAPFTGKVVPTTENLAIEIWRRLAPQLAGPTAQLRSIRLYETEDLYVDYAGTAHA